MVHEIFKTIGFYSSKEEDHHKKDIQASWTEDEGNMPLTDDELQDRMVEDIDVFYEDEKHNLNLEISGRILCIADLGLWNGRANGYSIMGTNLKDVLGSRNLDDFKVYVERGNVKMTGHHHDGTNNFTYREIREDRNIDNLTDMIYSGKEISRSVLNYYTKPLGHYVKEIFGW